MAAVMAAVDAATVDSQVTRSQLLGDVVAALNAQVSRGLSRGVDERSVTLAALAVHADAAQVAAAGAAFDTAKAGLALEPYISSLVSAGVNAEELCWAVISFEAMRHIRLIHHETNKLVGRFDDRPAEDMVTYGWMGLRLALRRFDPDRGLLFSTYACKRISGAIRDGLRAESPLAKRLITKARRITAGEEQLAILLGRTPTRAEVAEQIDMTLEELAMAPRFAAPASIEEIRASLNTRDAEMSALTTGDVTAEAAGDDLLREAVVTAFSELPDELAEVAELVLYRGMSVAEAGRVTGVPARQVRARCNTAREQLAVALSGWAA